MHPRRDRQLALASIHLQHTGLGGRPRDAVLDHNAVPPQPRRSQDIPGTAFEVEPRTSGGVGFLLVKEFLQLKE
jgi:hypothetical protein